MTLTLKHTAGAIIATALMTSQAFGGQIVKNGGAIVNGDCYVENGTWIRVTELLDFYEAKVLRSWQLALGDASVSVEDKVEMMLSRLEQVDPTRAVDIRAWLATFDQERGWLNNGAELPTVDDVGEITQVLPNGCRVRQAAGQRLPDNPPFDPYYIINTSWWNQLDNDSRAGLIVHELIYRDGVRRGHLNSIGTRFLTSLLATDLVDRGVITPDVYSGILFRNRFDSFTYYRLRYYPEAQLTSTEAAQAFCANLAADSEIVWLYDYNRLTAGSSSFELSSFKTSALGRYLFEKPEAARLFRTLQGVVRLTPVGFMKLAEDQELPAPALCSVQD